MRKYWEIAKTYTKTQLVWRADVIFNMIFTISKILFAYLLWGIIFQGKEMVGAFTFHGMLSYYIVSSFLSQLEMSDGISGEIHARIRNGTFSKYMVIPVRIELYFMAMELGVVLFYLAFDFIAAVVWIFVFRIQFVFAAEGVVIACAVVMAVLGMVFMVQLNYLLGLLTLKYQGIGTFLMIKNNLASLITGSIIPLALFPESVVSVMRMLPFYYVTYLPSMLLTGMCGDEAMEGIAIICCWCAAIQIVIWVTQRKYFKTYDGVGI
ncbi:MAG: ABC transporter permease [Lachnospiraceae bacterium]|nr:ABC transporter permease [Lachnospiraceae bacterium]